MDAWLDAKGQTRGAVLSLDEMWALAEAWYAPRLSADWRGRDVDQVRALLAGVGLIGDFWAVG